MRASAHVRLFLIATIVWAVFWVAGLPSYYQQYSTVFMVWFDVVLLLVLAGIGYRVLRRVAWKRRTAISLWIAFYFTFPLAIYDWLYCGVHLGNGLSFLWRYWYLTVYYLIPWLLLPGIAAMLGSTDRVGREDSERHPTNG